MRTRCAIVTLLLLLTAPALSRALPTNAAMGPAHALSGPGAAEPSRPPSYLDSTSLVAVWFLDDATGATRVQGGGTCGADCNLTNNSSSDGIDLTITYMEAHGAALFQDDADSDGTADDEFLSCADATCDELDFTSSYSIGCWARVANTVVGVDRIINKETATDGYLLSYTALAGFNCIVRGAGESDNPGELLVIVPDVFNHLGCVFNDAGNTIDAYRSGDSRASAAHATVDATAEAFTLSDGTAADDLDGILDECFAFNAALTEAQMSHIASCGIDSTLCTCLGTTYLDHGRFFDNQRLGADATPGACNAAIP